MRALPDLLELGEGARLTGVALLPVSRDISSTAGRIVMQAAVGTSEQSSVAASAVVRFLPDAAVVINGVQADGREWFATFEHVARHDPEPVGEISRAGVIRALDLTGIGVDRIGTHAFTSNDLGEVYAARGIDSVDDWTILDLLLGLILDLFRGDLAGVVAELTVDSSQTEARAAYRRNRIDAALRDWAAFYEGPECPTD
jgi:hypothetical protein